MYSRPPPPPPRASSHRLVPRQEDLKIGSVFSVTADSSTSPAPTGARLNPLACSNCKRLLVEGDSGYQRKGHADIFCAIPCLLRFYQAKPVNKSCHYCLQ